MDIKKKSKELRERLAFISQESNKLRNQLNNFNIEIIQIQGQLKLLEEMEKEEK